MSEELNKNAGCSPEDCASCGGCGSPLNEHRTITLTMDDDSEVVCAVLTTFKVGEKEYIALMPLDENGLSSQGEVYLYTFRLSPSGDPLLDNIEDDDEYQAAGDAFNELLENARLAAASDPEDENP